MPGVVAEIQSGAHFNLFIFHNTTPEETVKASRIKSVALRQAAPDASFPSPPETIGTIKVGNHPMPNVDALPSTQAPTGHLAP